MAITLLNAVTTTGAGTNSQPIKDAPKTYQAIVTGTGSVSATVVVEVSNDGVNFLSLGTITLSGTTKAFDGFASQATWNYCRGNVTAITAGNAVTLLMGI